jgi:hypothetical protein
MDQSYSNQKEFTILQQWRNAGVHLPVSSQVRSTWKQELHTVFSSSLEMLDEMKPIRCIEHAGKAKHITAFFGRQRDICKAFGFTAPKGCELEYEIRKVEPKKRPFTP